MFQFQKTRMLHEALLSDKAPLSPGRQVLVFLLIFFVASMGQSIILLPAQLIAVFLDEAFQSAMLENSVGGLERIVATMEAITKALTNLPSWVMVVQLFSTAVLIAVCLFYCIKMEKRSFVSLGFVKKGSVLEYLSGMGIGLVMFSAAVLLCVVTQQGTFELPSDVSHIPWGMIILYFIGFLVQGMSEEILCRSYFMMSLSRGCKLWTCVLSNALLFASLHIFNPGITPLALVNLTLFGIFASVYTLRRGSIWGISAIHSLWNFAQGNVFGVAVSGMGDNPTVFHLDTTQGSAWINGGSFGLEGGLAVTVVLLIGILLVLLTKTKKSELIDNIP